MVSTHVILRVKTIKRGKDVGKSGIWGFLWDMTLVLLPIQIAEQQVLLLKVYFVQLLLQTETVLKTYLQWSWGFKGNWVTEGGFSWNIKKMSHFSWKNRANCERNCSINRSAIPNVLSCDVSGKMQPMCPRILRLMVRHKSQQLWISV